MKRLICLIFKTNWKRAVSAISFLILSCLVSGCVSLPSGEVKVFPGPMRSFPPTEPALVRLPVVILFPTRAEVVQHITDFFKNGLRPKMDDPGQPPIFHLKFNVKDIWAKIQEPIYLDKNVWILIRPETLSLGSMRSDPKNPLTVQTVVETTANPEVFFGPKPSATPVPIPLLRDFIPGPPTFQAVSNTFISYKEANIHFKDPKMKLIGMVLTGTGQKLTIDGIRLYGSGGQVVVEVKLHYNPLIVNLESKPAKLTVYLKGTPRYLPKEEVFDMPDLDYDVKSSDLMVQMADLFFKTDFRNQLRKIARFPIGPKIEELKRRIDFVLNRPIGRFMKFTANVSSFQVIDGLADDEGLVVRVSIKGTAALDVTWN